MCACPTRCTFNLTTVKPNILTTVNPVQSVYKPRYWFDVSETKKKKAMLMIGEGNRLNPTVHISPCSYFDDPTAKMMSPLPVSGVSVEDCSPFVLEEFLTALHRYIPSRDTDSANSDISGYESYVTSDTYSSDEFRMYDFKVRRCTRGRTHEWIDCPYVHPGEKARRRDPRKFHYCGTGCTEFRKGSCKKGDMCEYAHGIFECWLHPDRYRTQPCKDGTDCRRPVCFFAHTPEQLRVVTQNNSRTTHSMTQSPISSYDGSPLRHTLGLLLSPSSMSSASDSPPMSPTAGLSLNRSMRSNSINEIVASMRNLQLSKKKLAPTRKLVFNNSPAIPIHNKTVSGIGCLDFCLHKSTTSSTSFFREELTENQSKENWGERVRSASLVPDVGWVSELVQ